MPRGSAAHLASRLAGAGGIPGGNLKEDHADLRKSHTHLKRKVEDRGPRAADSAPGDAGGSAPYDGWPGPDSPDSVAGGTLPSSLMTTKVAVRPGIGPKSAVRPGFSR